MIANNAWRAVAGFLLIGLTGAANANLIQGGTFDTAQDLDDFWVQDGTIATTWDSGTAHLGRPGFDGLSILSQEFVVPEGANHLKIFFDYQWQVNQPNVEDLFGAFLIVDGVPPLTLLLEGSDDGLFGTTASFATQFSFAPLAAPVSVVLQFVLLETANDPNDSGTRIQLDNVRAEVPSPATLALMGLGLAGIGYRRRRVTAA